MREPVPTRRVYTPARPEQPNRYGLDAWEDMMMARDERLTGHKRGQKVRLTAVSYISYDPHHPFLTFVLFPFVDGSNRSGRVRYEQRLVYKDSGIEFTCPPKSSESPVIIVPQARHVLYYSRTQVL